MPHARPRRNTTPNSLRTLSRRRRRKWVGKLSVLTTASRAGKRLASGLGDASP